MGKEMSLGFLGHPVRQPHRRDQLVSAGGESRRIRHAFPALVVVPPPIRHERSIAGAVFTGALRRQAGTLPA
jgi:hypothetical protein